MVEETRNVEDAIGMEFEIALTACLFGAALGFVGALPMLTGLAMCGWVADALRAPK